MLLLQVTFLGWFTDELNRGVTLNRWRETLKALFNNKMNRHAKHVDVVWWTSMLSMVMQWSGQSIYLRTNAKVRQCIHGQKQASNNLYTHIRKSLAIYKRAEERLQQSIHGQKKGYKWIEEESSNLYTDRRKGPTIYTRTEEIKNSCTKISIRLGHGLYHTFSRSQFQKPIRDLIVKVLLWG